LEARNLSVLHCLCSGPNYQLGVSSLVGRVNLGFGSLRTLEGKYGLLGKRTLLSIVWTYGGDHQTYALQTVLADIHGTTKHMLRFE
jgi:hypothetical protein